jgi:hypothetical protein
MEIDKRDFYALLNEMKRIADALEKSNEINSNKFKFERKQILEKKNPTNNQEDGKKKGLEK